MNGQKFIESEQASKQVSKQPSKQKANSEKPLEKSNIVHGIRLQERFTLCLTTTSHNNRLYIVQCMHRIRSMIAPAVKYYCRACMEM